MVGLQTPPSPCIMHNFIAKITFFSVRFFPLALGPLPIFTPVNKRHEIGSRSLNFQLLMSTSSTPETLAGPKKRGRRPGKTHTGRIDFRLPAEVREKIELAAFHAGMSLSDFAASTLLERAESVLEKRRVTTLNEAQWERFTQILLHPPEPTDALVRLMRAGQKHARTEADGATRVDPRFEGEPGDDEVSLL